MKLQSGKDYNAFTRTSCKAMLVIISKELKESEQSSQGRLSLDAKMNGNYYELRKITLEPRTP